MKKILAIFSLLSLVVFYGCGGGGSGSFNVTTTDNHSVSGQVTAAGVGVSGVTVTATPTGSTTAVATVQTNASGNFTFTNLKNGTYTVAASLAGFTLSSNQQVTVNGSDVNGINFTATVTATFNVGGQVTANGTGLSGATVTLTPTGGTPVTTTTDASGNFTFTGKVNGTYTISATMTGFNMSAPQTITINGADQTAITFTATSTTGVFVKDTFQATGTTTLLQDHVADTGTGWQILNGTGSIFLDGPNSAIYSTADANYVNTATIPTSDYSVIATIHMNTQPFGIGGNCYISGRVDLNTHLRYIAGHTHGVGWGLYAVQDTGEVLLGSTFGDGVLAANSTHTVELRMVGSSIMMFVDNVLATSVTDTTVATGFHAGTEMSGTGPGSTGSYELSDYQVTAPTVH